MCGASPSVLCVLVVTDFLACRRSFDFPFPSFPFHLICSVSCMHPSHPSISAHISHIHLSPLLAHCHTHHRLPHILSYFIPFPVSPPPICVTRGRNLRDCHPPSPLCPEPNTDAARGPLARSFYLEKASRPSRRPLLSISFSSSPPSTSISDGRPLRHPSLRPYR